MPTSHYSNETEPDPIPNPEQTVGYVIQHAIKAEYSAREIYLQLLQMFAHVPNVSKFWQDLASDEAKHAYTLLKVRRSLSDEQLATAADRQLLDSIASTTFFLNKVSLDTVETLDDAYEIAHEIEYSEVNHLFKCLVGHFITHKERIQIVLSEIHEHQQKLTDFTENFGDRAWRKQISARSAASVPLDT